MFVRDVLLTFSTEIINAGLNFSVGILLARTLTPTNRGIMALVMTLPLLLFNVLNLGLHEATVFLIGRKKAQAESVLGNALTIAMIIGGIAMLFLILFKQQALTFVLKELPPELWIPLIILVPAGLVQAVLLSILRAKQSFTLFNAWRFFSSFFLFLAFLVVLVLLKGDLKAGIIVYIIVSLLLTGVALAFCARYVPITIGFNSSLSGEILRYGVKSYAQILIESMNYRLDVFLIALFLKEDQVAFYAVAVSLAEISWFLPNSVGSILFPRLTNTPIVDVNEITARVCRITIALTMLMVLATCLFCWPFVPWIYGPAYQSSILPLIILLPGILAMVLHKVLGRNFASKNQQQFTVVASLAAFVVILGLDLWLIPILGIRGAALASTLGYIIAGFMLLIFFSIQTHQPILSVILINKTDIWANWQRIKQISRSRIELPHL